MKDKILSIFRTALIAVGSYLTGKFFLGVEIDDNTIAGWISLIVTLASAVWSFVDKTAGVEQVQSAVRNILIAFGALLIPLGKLNDQTMELILLVADTVLGATLGVTSRIKNEKIADGSVRLADLSGVKESTPITPNTNPVKTK